MGKMDIKLTYCDPIDGNRPNLSIFNMLLVFYLLFFTFKYFSFLLNFYTKSNYIIPRPIFCGIFFFTLSQEKCHSTLIKNNLI